MTRPIGIVDRFRRSSNYRVGYRVGGKKIIYRAFTRGRGAANVTHPRRCGTWLYERREALVSSTLFLPLHVSLCLSESLVDAVS